MIAVTLAVPGGSANAVSYQSSVSGSCEAFGGSLDETCLTAVSVSSIPIDPAALSDQDFVALASNAVTHAVRDGDASTAEDFVSDASGDLSDAEIDQIEGALDRAETSPKKSPRTPVIRSKSRALLKDVGDPQYQTTYAQYWHVKSNGASVLISTTTVQFWHYVNTNPADFGDKALSLHLTRSSGQDTYYRNVVCKLRRSDTFADNDVMTWNKCPNPDFNGVNDYDMYREDRDYYGNWGDKYYNKVWFDINPAGSTYPARRVDASGPKWKNPDGGGAPRWL
ncbi:hypothetical protein EXE59_16770 [Nocardioides eburneiflavus]|uniref:Uncharacterized protein n=1 Tax=Nocardioides eburneiflavus TaxID=2518372 RepID=A0A4Z1CI05_9ACTN|nr:hypothetical protein [Nocardioides eburneiflavus]TGN65427.1 hypothetical protein EXE59_16770 [Nocardioides eburneiflavus]